MPASQIRNCIWTYNDIDDYYKAGCDKYEEWIFQFNKGGPEENKFVFYPYCRGRIKIREAK